MPRLRVAALLSACAVAASAVVAACSGFSSEETPSINAADAETVDSGGILAADAAPLCGETALCLNFDDERIPLSYGGLMIKTSSALDSGIALVERTKAGAVSKPFAAGFSIDGQSFVSATLNMSWPASQSPRIVRIRGFLNVEFGTPDTAALAIIIGGRTASGSIKFVSLLIFPKPAEPTLATCKLVVSEQGGSTLEPSRECGGGEIFVGVPQAFSMTVDLTLSGGRVSFALDSAGETQLTASGDLAAADLSTIDSIDFGAQSGFFGSVPEGGARDAGAWRLQFDDVSIEPKPGAQ